MKIRLVKDLSAEELYLIDENDEYYEWCDIVVDLGQVYEVITGQGAALAMDDKDDQLKLLSLLLEVYNRDNEEEEVMQEVPDDAIILTPDEAQAIVDYLDEVRYPDEEEPLASAVRALDEQLEYDYDDVD